MVIFLTKFVELSFYSVYDLILYAAAFANVAIEICCLLGYIIVGNCIKFLKTVYQITYGVLKLLQVVIEDYSVFVADLVNIGHAFALRVQQFFEDTFTLISFGYYSVVKVYNLCIDVIASLCNFLLYILSSVLHAYVLCKKTFLYVGLSVWNFVTEIPHFVLSLLYYFVYLVCDLITGLNLYLLSIIVSVLEHVRTSILEFPVKPLCGLCLAALLSCIILKKRRSLYHFSYRTWFLVTSQCQQLLLSGWQNFEGYVLWLLTNQRRERRRYPIVERTNENYEEMFNEADSDTSSDDSSNTTVSASQEARKRKTSHKKFEDLTDEQLDVRLCVVCQDKVRCIVTLPCRHVCLCKTCCSAVREHQGVCPLCRQEINFAERVYL